MTAVAGAEVVARATRELSRDERAALHGVFDAAYHEPDHAYLDRCLDAGNGVGFAVDPDERVVAFTLYGWRELDLPHVGTRGIGLPGLSCVRPDVRGSRLGDATTAAAGSIAVRGALHLAYARLATPASLRWVLRSVPMGSWPTADDVFALYAHPTQAQRDVAAALVRQVDDLAYVDGVAVGLGRTIGTPIIEPEVTDELRAWFERVDRARGDALIWVAWLAPPPPAWFAD